MFLIAIEKILTPQIDRLPVLFHFNFLPRLDFSIPDRFCAAEQVDGKWNVFTGDQIGSLLGYAALQRYKQSELPIGKQNLSPLTPVEPIRRTSSVFHSILVTDSKTSAVVS